MRETVDRLRQSQEENEIITRRRDELEGRVMTLETEYEELLGTQRVKHYFARADYLYREDNS